MVYSLLSMLGTHDKDDMSRTLLAMSSSQDSCIAMRQSGNDDVHDVNKGNSDDAYNVLFADSVKRTQAFETKCMRKFLRFSCLEHETIDWVQSKI